jgi:hypothetical protein
MVYGFYGGRGGRGGRRGAGLGFRGSSPPYPYIGRGRGGLPRCQYPGATFPFRDTFIPSNQAQMTNEQELDALKRQAEDIKKELESIESRIRELGATKKE